MMLPVTILAAICALPVYISAIPIPHRQVSLGTPAISDSDSYGTAAKSSAQIATSKIRPPHLEEVDYGVGIAFSTDYATVSIAYKNGTIVDIAKVDAQQEFKTLMEKLSLKSSKHASPPYIEASDVVFDHQRQMDRAMRKSQSLPASEEVRIIADLLRTAREEAELYLWQPIDAATISTPNLVGLYAEDVADAMDFIGLDRVDPPNEPALLIHNSASTVISNGFGLCKDMTALDNCLHHAVDRPTRTAITIEYTRNSLMIEAMDLRPEMSFWPAPISQPQTYFNLGYDMLKHKRADAFYWAAMAEVLTKSIMSCLMERKQPTQYFVSGETAADSTFLAMLEKVARTLIGQAPEIIVEDSLYAASRGAAYLGARGGVHALLS